MAIEPVSGSDIEKAPQLGGLGDENDRQSRRDVEKVDAATDQTHGSDSDPNLVDWSSPTDATNPKNWSLKRKWSATLTFSAIGLMAIMNSSIVAPALPAMSETLAMSPVQANMSMSIYILASAFGPLILAPLSEIYGRVKIVHFCNIWFVGWSFACAFANTKGLLIAARFLAGLGGSLIYALGQAQLGDCWRPDQRGLSLGISAFIPLLGSAIGATVGGYIVQGTGNWRWIFWVTTIAQGVTTFIAFFSYQETHAATILRKKARLLRQTTGNPEMMTVFERLDEGKSVFGILGRSLTRPMRLFFTHPIIPIVAVYGAVNFGILYLVLTTFSSLWVERYHTSTQVSGLHYIAFVIGEVFGAQIGAPITDRIWAYLKRRGEGEVSPEYRVPLMIPGVFLVPIGLFWYGWSAQFTVFWVVPDIGIAIFGVGLMLSTQAQQAYVIDAFPDHTASAYAAVQFIRASFAFVFPLFAPKLYRVLDYGWANSLLGFIVLALGAVGPFVIWTYGAKLRARAQSSY